MTSINEINENNGLLDSLLEAYTTIGVGLDEIERSHADRAEFSRTMDLLLEAYINELGDN